MLHTQLPTTPQPHLTHMCGPHTLNCGIGPTHMVREWLVGVFLFFSVPRLIAFYNIFVVCLVWYRESVLIAEIFPLYFFLVSLCMSPLCILSL